MLLEDSGNLGELVKGVSPAQGVGVTTAGQCGDGFEVALGVEDPNPPGAEGVLKKLRKGLER